MSVVDRIFEKFVTLRAFADAMGHKNVTTVQGWRDRGRVPMDQIPGVMAVCAKHGLTLDYSDFFNDTPSGSETATEGATR